MVHKYNVGDKVLVRKDLICGKEYCSLRVCDEMLAYRGKVATITSKCTSDNEFRIDLDDGDWFWNVVFFTNIDDLPNTLVINGKTYTADNTSKCCEKPAFKPFTINIDTLDDAKNLWHRLNAATSNFERYASKLYKEFEELQSRHSNIWWHVNSAIEKQGFEMDSCSKDSY